MLLDTPKGAGAQGTIKFLGEQSIQLNRTKENTAKRDKILIHI